MKFISFFSFFLFVQLINGQIVINEVMVNPQTDPTNSQFQSLKMCSQSTNGSEYIELYNASGCAVDISCYLIGFNSSYSTGVNGTFRFPAGTIIQGGSFLSVGGPNSGATINLFTQCSGVNLNTGADRWFLPNGDGYLIIWDSNGNAIDAVYWTSNAGESSKWGTDSDISIAPTFIAQGSTCNPINALSGPGQIPVTSSVVFYAGQSPTIGTVIHRVVDGGANWATNATPSINACNGVCNNFSSFQLNANVTQPTCGNSDGIINFNPSPSDTYFYNWPFPTNGSLSNATSLAAGSYQITITNLAGCSKDTTIVLTEDCQGCGLSATTSVIPNSVCQPCNYNGPSILINEINIFPNSGDGSIFGVSPTAPGNGEWIELFNPNWCDSVDISGFILGSYNSTGNAPGTPLASPPYVSNGMAFEIPAGTIVPPLGFVIVRGASAALPPSSAIDVIVNNSNNQACIEGGMTNSRIWFQNTGSWFAFYNAQGVPQDAIQWGTPTNNSDLNQSPCIPPNNSLPAGTTTLPSFNQISAMGLTSSLGASSQGFTFRRMPDGGSWSATLAQETSSYAACNDPANCDVFSGVSQCNGSATVNVTSGTAPYQFQWNDPLNQITQTAVNLCEGTYIVVVTDANACSETYQVSVVDNPFSFVVDMVQPDCLQSNGSISLNPFNANYNYSWLPNVSTSNSASNLPQGSYTVTISDGSCSFDTTVVLQNPTPFTASIISENTTCGENNGVINVIINPPGNYTLTWTPNVSTTQSNSTLAPGNYSINISDNICETTLTANIASSLPITANVQVQNTSCNEANGAIWIDLSPLANYSYVWSPNVSSVDSALNLQSGNYQIQFSDGVCSSDTTLSVAPSPAPSDILYNVTPTNCGTNNGSISITQVTGGQSPFTYSFNGQQSFGNTQDTISLANQNYLIAVKDVNNCVYQEIVAIPEIPGPNDILSLDTNPTCGLNNGSISLLSIVGGVTPFSYQFDSQVLSDTIISNLLAGSYLIQVTDIFGCSFQKNINLIDEAGISSIFIPNVFTPNEDNLNTNEYWKVEATCIKSVKGIILNRWGDKVFEFDELFDSWDGTTKSGESVKDGVYYYEVEFTYFDEKAEIFHGHITVIR